MPAPVNLAPNPSFENSSGQVEVRRNRIVNPGPAVTTGWAPIGTGTVTVSGGHLITTVTADSVTATIPRIQVVGTAGATPVVPGETVPVRCEVKHSRGLKMEMRVWFMDAAGVYIAPTVISAVSGATTDWTALNVSALAPALAAWMGYQIIVRSDLTDNNSLTGDIFEVQKFTTDPGPYFDGSSPAAGDFSYIWASLVNDSASIQYASNVADVAVPPANQDIMYRSADTPLMDTYVLRHRITGLPTAPIGIPTTSFLPTTGLTYTLRGRVRPRNRNQTFTPRIRQTSGQPFTALKDVWTEFRTTLAAGAGNNQQTGLLMLANSGHQTEDLIDLDALFIAEGTQTPEGWYAANVPSNADLELAFLIEVKGATGPTLADARRQIYGEDLWAYFAGLSGLTPAKDYTLNDHRYTYYRAQSAFDGTVNDCARVFWFRRLTGTPPP